MSLYYALGDSMSIDAYAGGPGQGAASLLAADLGLDLRMLARDGATSDGVVRTQVAEVDRTPDLITVTMGGNDLLDVLFSPTGPPADAAWVVGRIASNYERVLDRLIDTGARIMLTTVYDPTDGTGDLTSAGLPAFPDGPAILDAVNDQIRAAAARHGVLLADVHGAFLGHGISAGDITGSEARPANRDLWYCGHIEPNAWGARAIKETWQAALAAV